MDGTALYIATSTGHVVAMEMLLQHGVNTELGGREGTPLMMACEAGRLDAVKLLISKGASTDVFENGAPACILDMARYHPEVVRWLLVGRFRDHPKMIGACRSLVL